MKKSISIILICFMITLAFGCQSVTVSNTTASSETSQTISESPEICVSWAPMQFESTQQLVNYLRQCRNATVIQDVDIQNFIQDGIVTVYEPSFTPPDGFRATGITVHYAYCAYHYQTEALIASHEQLMSSQHAAAQAELQSRSYPISSYEIMVESSELYGEPKTSSEQAILHAQQKAEDKFRAESRITIEWCTQKSDDPLPWVIEHYALKPLGDSENPKYYYKEQVQYGEVWAYDVYWNMNGYRCYAYIPAILASEESIAKICSLRPVTAPCFD